MRLSIMLNSNQLAIIVTLCYSAQFQYPLTIDEIYQRLIKINQFKQAFPQFKQLFPQQKTRQHQSKKISTMINDLIKKKLLIDQQFVRSQANRNHSSLYTLNNKKANFEMRLKRQKIFLRRNHEVVKLINIANKIPFIKGIALTGSAALANIDQDSDFDFLIVTEKKRLWLTRFILLTISFLLNKRKFWCFNLWLEDDQLVIPVKQRNFYTAFEVLQTKWLYENKKNSSVSLSLATEFQQKNSWLKDYLLNFKINHSPDQKKVSQTAKPLLLTNKILAFSNQLCYFIQAKYRQLKYQELLAYQSAFFFDSNYYQQIYQKWWQLIKKSGIIKDTQHVKKN